MTLAEIAAMYYAIAHGWFWSEIICLIKTLIFIKCQLSHEKFSWLLKWTLDLPSDLLLLILFLLPQKAQRSLTVTPKERTSIASILDLFPALKEFSVDLRIRSSELPVAFLPIDCWPKINVYTWTLVFDEHSRNVASIVIQWNEKTDFAIKFCHLGSAICAETTFPWYPCAT
jgi:hypothetical protein